MLKLKIASDYTTAPGPRKRDEGKYSGQQFREELLIPRLKEAEATSTKLLIDLDGTSGYGTSFLEEAFGGLIRENGYRLETLDFLIQVISDEEPDLLDEIREYLEDADKEASKS